MIEPLAASHLPAIQWSLVLALAALEERASAGAAQVDLFAPPPAADLPTPSATEALLAQINPDALSPREALEALYQLKATLATP